MDTVIEAKNKLNDDGFSVINDVYTENEIIEISTLINQLDTSNPIFRKTDDLFAIRQFIKEVPEIKNLIFNAKLKNIIHQIGNSDFFIVKSIYFDKPEKSNWFVSYHQDLTISVNEKKELTNFTNWTKKHNQFAVQPPTDILENIFTIRIHLDDTNSENGALKVLKKSHQKSVSRIDAVNFLNEEEVICNVKSGGIMLMKPLTYHGSNKTTNNKNRRVIHIELSNRMLPEGIRWSEYAPIFS